MTGVSHRWRCGVGLVCLLIAGCASGEKLTTVRGKVVEEGQPIAIRPYEEGGNCLQVLFIPADDSGAIVNAPVHSDYASEDGTFEISGDMGKGIPLRKYRVAILRVGMSPTSGSSDLWKGKFDAQKTPFVVDVTGSQGDVVIDIAHPPGG